MKLGARILKTGIAVVVALYVCQLLDLESVAAIAAIAAVLTVQPSLYRSWKHLLEQVQANVIGVSFAIAGVLLLGSHPVVIGITIIVVIALCLRLGFHTSIELAVLSVIAVSFNVSEDYLPFALERFILIMIGIFASMLVNMLFLPPKYETKLMSQIKDTRAHMSLLMRNMIYQEITSYPTEKKRVQESLKRVATYYELYTEDRPSYYKSRKSPDAMRKLLIFRKMTRILERELEVIQAIERHRGGLASLPPNLLENIHLHVEDLAVYHQKIIGKFEGTIKATYPHERSQHVFAGEANLLHDLMNLYNPQSEDETWVHLFPIVATLSELARQLDHLDKLVNVYCAYHKK